MQAPTPPSPTGGGLCPATPFDQRQPIELGMEQEFNDLDAQLARQILTPLLGEVQSTSHTWLSWLGQEDIRHKGENLSHWRTVPDVTLSTFKSFELISAPLPYNETSLLSRATQHIVEHGGTTDSMTALHIHVNHASLSPAAVMQILEVAHVQRNLIFRLSRTSPRQVGYFCRPLEAGLLKRLRQHPPASKAAIAETAAQEAKIGWRGFTYSADIERYYIINLHYLAAGNTLEYRQFDATSNPLMVQAFVDLSLALTSAARDSNLTWLAQRPLNPDIPADAELFLDSIGLAADRFAVSRMLLLQNAHHPRPFEFAASEALQLSLDLAVAVGGIGYFLRHSPTFVGSNEVLATTCLGAFARGSTLLAERYGLASFELTHAVRSLTYGRLFLAQIIYVAIMAGLWRR